MANGIVDTNSNLLIESFENITISDEQNAGIVAENEERDSHDIGNKEQEDQIQAVYDASMAEIEAGTASGPFTYSHLEKRFGYGKFRPMMRSVIAKNGKYRAVDNGKEMTNFPAAVGRLFAEKLSKHLFEKAFSILYSSLGLITKN
jgi:hypothetical protein